MSPRQLFGMKTTNFLSYYTHFRFKINLKTYLISMSLKFSSVVFSFKFLIVFWSNPNGTCAVISSLIETSLFGNSDKGLITISTISPKITNWSFGWNYHLPVKICWGSFRYFCFFYASLIICSCIFNLWFRLFFVTQ